jgi:hypothetical protein
MKYSKPSVYERSVYEFSLIRDEQINTCFSIYEPIFAHTSSFLSQTDRCSRRLFSGSNGKLIFVLRVFVLRAVLEERIKLVNRGIPVIWQHYTLKFEGNAMMSQYNKKDRRKPRKSLARIVSSSFESQIHVLNHCRPKFNLENKFHLQFT